jgi:hypothetical protein
MEKRSIKEMTYEELCHIANIATGGYFNSQWAKEHEEVEVGGYGWRRRVEWTQNTEGYDEYHYFEITGENKGDGWHWHCKSTIENKPYVTLPEGEDINSDKLYLKAINAPKGPNWSKGHIVNTLNPHKIVDYCRERGLDIENTLR